MRVPSETCSEEHATPSEEVSAASHLKKLSFLEQNSDVIEGSQYSRRFDQFYVLHRLYVAV